MTRRSSRIVKNTAFLYLRMLITMVVALYTSRVLLEILGAEDFGLYHVVAGFVVLAGFMQGALSGTTQRFMAFELGKKEESRLQRVFSMSVNIHILFAFMVALIGGGLGAFFLPSILTFDDGRTTAVMIVFWFSLLSFMVNIAIVPCHAMIVAHEEMKIFAWVSIADALLKLGVVFLVQLLTFDPLATYGVLVFLVTLSIGSVYLGYVHFRYKKERFSFLWSQTLFRELISFSGWTIWGNAASVFATQGTNILLNIFFGPIVNAAKSVGTQASAAINQFVTNLQLAINPQIIKSYSANDLEYTNRLLNYGSKYNFFLVFTLALPVLLRTEEVLNTWLVDTPPYAVIFLRLILVNMVIESISRPLITAAQATGNIKLYQLVVGGVLLLNLPLAYFLLKAGGGPESVFVVAIVLTLFAAIVRIYMLKRIFQFSVVMFLNKAIFRILLVSAISSSVLFLMSYIAPITLSFIELLLFLIVSVSITGLVIWLVGFERHERDKVVSLITLKLRATRT